MNTIKYSESLYIIMMFLIFKGFDTQQILLSLFAMQQNNHGKKIAQQLLVVILFCCVLHDNMSIKKPRNSWWLFCFIVCCITIMAINTMFVYEGKSCKKKYLETTVMFLSMLVIAIWNLWGETHNEMIHTKILYYSFIMDGSHNSVILRIQNVMAHAQKNIFDRWQFLTEDWTWWRVPSNPRR